MYAIINQGELLGYCEEPRYVKLNDNEIFVQTGIEDATHVAYNSIAYDLHETYVKEVDVSEVVRMLNENINNSVDPVEAQSFYTAMMTDTLLEE